MIDVLPFPKGIEIGVIDNEAKPVYTEKGLGLKVSKVESYFPPHRSSESRWMIYPGDWIDINLGIKIIYPPGLRPVLFPRAFPKPVIISPVEIGSGNQWIVRLFYLCPASGRDPLALSKGEIILFLDFFESVLTFKGE